MIYTADEIPFEKRVEEIKQAIIESIEERVTKWTQDAYTGQFDMPETTDDVIFDESWIDYIQGYMQVLQVATIELDWFSQTKRRPRKKVLEAPHPERFTHNVDIDDITISFSSPNIGDDSED